MKKNIYILVIVAVLLLSGCSKKDQMTNFIPTIVPGEDSSEEITPSVAEDGAEATQAPKTIYVGETTTMYVKLDEYGDTLNIRSKPSTEGKAVGFLVHTDKVEVIEIKDGWASFVYKDAICYVNADYLVDEKPDYLDPPTPTNAPKSNKVTPKSNKDTPKSNTDTTKNPEGPQI